jgi:putative transposase
MLRTRTYKYRLYPTRNQRRVLEHTIETCRILYNSCLADRRNYYQAKGKGLSRLRQQEILRDDKAKVERLLSVHSQVLQDVLFRVERAYDGFFRRLREKGGKAGYPRFKGEGQYDSIHYPQQPGFMFTPNGLKLSKIGTIKIVMHRPVHGTIKTCTVRRDVDQWYACITAETAVIPEISEGPHIGIDVGIRSFAVLSNGDVIENPRHLGKSMGTLRKKQRRLSRKKAGSSSRRKAKIAVARLHRKVRNQRSDFHHKVSRQIVTQYGNIAVEDLNISGMARNHRLAGSIADAGWGQFIRYLAYKAENAGCMVVKVPARNTSITCSRCGSDVRKSLSERTHRCHCCGIVLDRDYNAAINIKNRAGTARIHACREKVHQGHSLKQEAASVRAW